MASSSPSSSTVRPLAPGAAASVPLKLLLKIHWISSAVCLLGMLLFAATGITLNHAAKIESAPVTRSVEKALPAPLHERLQAASAASPAKGTALPTELASWLRDELAVDVGAIPAEWSADEVYVPLPRPGGDAWLRIDLAEGSVEYEITDRGWISWLNDLHKGRHTGEAWSWFIDIFAGSCLLFSLSGLWILKRHAAQRPSTWPLVGLGVIVPLLIALLFIH